ncbi:MAG: hypothetical protein JSR46_09355, partial [Verrucomicrobia bacterium]|nr:hypothetical protein [Verrucomicrobiota bacterium]
QEVSHHLLTSKVEELIQIKAERCSNLFKKMGLHYPPEAWKTFFEIFGFYGLQMPKSMGRLHDERPLDEVIEEIGDGSNELIVGISRHLHALSQAPEQYQQGLEAMVLAMPTYGKDLSREAWLPSVAVSMKKICRFLSISPVDHPIFVFDQSEEPVYRANEAYIETLREAHGVRIVHLDRDEIVALAQKHQIEELIVTTSDGQFGFGGARNSVFLLAPALKGNKDVAIHMGDDDVHVPASTLFSDALFTYFHKDEYFSRSGLVVGRKTVEVFGSLDLSYVLQKVEDIVLCSKWVHEPFFHGMAGLLSKPKVCLDIPHGQEESSLEAMQKYLFDIRKPLVHLAGARYPAASLPVNRFSGLASFLSKQNVYVLTLLQINDLIDPYSLHKRCALPWNTKGTPFSSLDEAVKYMIQPEIIAEM